MKTFSRNPARARAMGSVADEIATGDATKPESLKGVLDGVEAVVSCLGAPVRFTVGDRRSFREVDTVANLNLLGAAQEAGVSRFVYVSVHMQPDYAQTTYIRAHEEVISELSKSGISFGVVRPTGIFPIFDPLLAMARLGVAWMPGNGSALTNPVHPLDVAEACVEVLTLGQGVCVSVGGPDIVSREEIVRMAFEAVGKEPRILHLPRLMLLAFAALLRPLHPHIAEVLEFATGAFTSELIAPARGRRPLAEYFAERASSLAA